MNMAFENKNQEASKEEPNITESEHEEKGDSKSEKRTSSVKSGGSDKCSEKKHESDDESDMTDEESGKAGTSQNNHGAPGDALSSRAFISKKKRVVKDDDSEDGKHERVWQLVTPEMIAKTLEKNSHRRAASTLNEVVDGLRKNYPVCQDQALLEEEVKNKLLCAQEIGLVVRVGNEKFRLSTPLEKTFITEWEEKEFWSKYREILRRGQRQVKRSRAGPSRGQAKNSKNRKSSRRIIRRVTRPSRAQDDLSDDSCDDEDCSCHLS